MPVQYPKDAMADLEQRREGSEADDPYQDLRRYDEDSSCCVGCGRRMAGRADGIPMCLMCRVCGPERRW